MHLIEITWNSDGGEELISQLRAELPACTIGTGTLLTLDHLEQAIAAGAQFLFTPHINPAMIQAAAQRSVPIARGALSYRNCDRLASRSSSSQGVSSPLIQMDEIQSFIHSWVADGNKGSHNGQETIQKLATDRPNGVDALFIGLDGLPRFVELQ